MTEQATQGVTAKPEQPANALDVLKERGLQGWELVALAEGHAYFKRPIATDHLGNLTEAASDVAGKATSFATEIGRMGGGLLGSVKDRLKGG